MDQQLRLRESLAFPERYHIKNRNCTWFSALVAQAQFKIKLHVLMILMLVLRQLIFNVISLLYQKYRYRDAKDLSTATAHTTVNNFISYFISDLEENDIQTMRCFEWVFKLFMTPAVVRKETHDYVPIIITYQTPKKLLFFLIDRRNHACWQHKKAK